MPMQYSNELWSRRSCSRYDKDTTLRRPYVLSSESVSLPAALSLHSCSRHDVGEEHRQWMLVVQTPTTLAIIYSHQSTLKHVDSCCILLLSAHVSWDCI